MNYKYQR